MSDREIFKQSGFNELLDPGDVLLADRGFNIEDLTLLKGAKLKMPPFLRGRKKFTYQELVESRLITRARYIVLEFLQMNIFHKVHNKQTIFSLISSVKLYKKWG